MASETNLSEERTVVHYKSNLTQSNSKDVNCKLHVTVTTLGSRNNFPDTLALVKIQESLTSPGKDDLTKHSLENQLW